MATFFTTVENPDFFWHFAAGRWIIQNHALPRADFLSWSRAGTPWVDFEWLTQIFYYLLYSAAGLRALYALKVALFSVALWILIKQLRLYNAGGLLYAALPLWAAALLPNLDIRPENFTLLFFTAEFYFLELMRLDKIKISPWKLFAVSLAGFGLWGNFHAGCFYGAMLVVFFAAGELARVMLPAVYGKPRADNFGKTAMFAAILAGGAMGPLLNPYGIGVYTVTFSHYRDMAKLQEYIVEWQVPAFANIVQRPYWFLVFLGFGVMIWRSLKYRDIPYAHLLAMLYFGLASSQYSRYTMFYALVAVPCTVYALRDTKLSARAEKLLKCAAAVVFMATVLHLSVWARAALGRSPWRHSVIAEGACRYLETNRGRLAPLRLYNPWEWGGYISYRLYPAFKTFQDGRYIFHGNLELMRKAESDNISWQSAMRGNGVQLAVMKRRRGFFHPEKAHSLKTGRTSILSRPYYHFFMPKQDWSLVYWDAYSLVFVRNDSADPRWLEENRFTVVRPDDLEAARWRLRNDSLDKKVFNRELQMLLRRLGVSDALTDTQSEFAGWQHFHTDVNWRTQHG
ncbi:MAG: hypothetical protein PHP45_00870 [Elusimicrobiales bacterium]|nr:hypothetical protein [Elusimicrobiales bacterium]